MEHGNEHSEERHIQLDRRAPRPIILDIRSEKASANSHTNTGPYIAQVKIKTLRRSCFSYATYHILLYKN